MRHGMLRVGEEYDMRTSQHRNESGLASWANSSEAAMALHEVRRRKPFRTQLKQMKK
jgi:hypothetical protein